MNSSTYIEWYNLEIRISQVKSIIGWSFGRLKGISLPLNLGIFEDP